MDDNEWQTIPDEWLEATADDEKSDLFAKTFDPRQSKTGLESDDDSVSDLTELSDGSEVQADDANDDSSAMSTEQEDQPPEPDKQSAEDQKALSGDFVEWETVRSKLNLVHFSLINRYALLCKNGSTLLTDGRTHLTMRKRPYIELLPKL